jgi:hypothetical protein
LIIGRNNSGKSALLEILQYATSGFTTNNFDTTTLGHKGKDTELFISCDLLEEDLLRVFPKGTSGGFIGGDYWEYGKKWVGKRITWGFGPNKPSYFLKMDPPFSGIPEANKANAEAKIATQKKNPLSLRVISFQNQTLIR